MLERRTRLRQRALKPKRRAREEATREAVAYKRFVGALPCAGCGGNKVDAHHAGQHGLGEKAHWSTLLPLCRRDHDALHDGKAPFADAERRRAWEARVQVDCRELYADHVAHRGSAGGVDMEMEARLRLSASLAWLKKGVE